MTIKRLLFSALLLGSIVNNTLSTDKIDSRDIKITVSKQNQQHVKLDLDDKTMNELCSEFNAYVCKLNEQMLELEKILQDIHNEEALAKATAVNLALNHYCR